MDRIIVLNVDDYEPGRYARSKLLKSFGFDVREAGNGQDALRLAAVDPPTLVILDVNLPDISGFEVCRELKKSTATATVPVLQMSATFTGAAHKVLGLESGADAYLTEPVEAPLLLATVNALLRMKWAEEASRASVEQWRVTFEAISDGVALLDGDGVIVRCNEAFRRLLGDSGADVVGRPAYTLWVGEPFAHMRRSRRRKTVERDHAGRWCRITAEPVLDGGRLVGAVYTVADITERREIEEERLRLLAREQMARAAAEAANRSKEEFIAILAHELRSPLAPIRMAMHTLRSQAERDPDVGRATSIVERQARHLARLLDDLLDASRLTREKIELRKTAVTLQTVVTEALEATRDLIETRDHTIELSLPLDPMWLDADSTRLTQVATNLLTNAARYTPPGGRIFVSGERDDAHVVLRVRDTGIGIPREMLDRIFELFTQGDRALIRAEGGLGIGLALARTLVELHGGTLTATSDGVARGSEFVVRLPVGLPPAPTNMVARGTAGALRSLRILLVEDNQDTRDILRIALELDGHHVEGVSDGAHGIHVARVTSPDVALVDIGLPGLNGYEVARGIRAALGESVLLIAVTGYGRHDDRRQADEAGFNAYLVKPVRYEELASLLWEWRRGSV